MGIIVVLAGVSIVLAVCCAVLCGCVIRAREAGVEAAAEVVRLRGEVESARMLAQAGEGNCQQRLAEKEENCRKRLEDKEAACQQRLAAMESSCAKQAQQAVVTLREQFANLAQRHLKESSEGLSELNRRRLDELMAPLRDQLKEFSQAFEKNKEQQVENKTSFEQAIEGLEKRAMQIGADAENLAKALKRESKTQGDWGEMVLGNILSAAGLKEGRDFFPQAQEVDEQGARLIPDVEIPLPNREKLLVDSKASVTAYLDYVAAQDEAAREAAAKAHVASVRKHMEELAEKNYTKRVKGSQGYILMFIPNEGSYLLAMERDRRLATDAFRRHVIIVNPTTLLLCLQIVALLRSRETQNENAEKISAAAAKMYEKFATFSATFVDLGKRLGGLAETYQKANGQLCAGPGNVVRQLESLKGMGVVTTKCVNERLLADAGVEG